MASDLRLLIHQLRCHQLTFWRNRRRALSALGLPVIFLVVFGAFTGRARLHRLGGLPFIDFYVPGIITYAAVVGCFTGTALALAFMRSEGIVKRLRTTPLPFWVFVAAEVGSALTVLAVATVVCLAVGLLFYGASLRPAALPGFLCALALGGCGLTALGIALSAAINRPEAGAQLVMVVLLPLLFISNVFFPVPNDKTVKTIGEAFPIWHLEAGLRIAFTQGGRTFPALGDLANLLVWALAGTAVAVRVVRRLAEPA